MSAIELLVRPLPADDAPSPPDPLRQTLDFMVDGVNLTARLGRGAALGLLGELGAGVGALSRGKRDRVTAPFYSGDEAWEIGLEADGDGALVSVYRTAPSIAVTLHERRVSLLALREALGEALDDARAQAPGSPGHGALAAARAALAAPWPSYGRAPLARLTLRVATPEGEPLVIHAEGRFRSRGAHRLRGTDDEPRLERADLHALLVTGAMRFEAGEAALELSPCFPFLIAERLLALADEALGAARDERPLFRRAELDGTHITLRSLPDEAGLTLRIQQRGGSDGPTAIANLDPRAFVTAAARFALGMEAAFLSSDPAQGANLRLQQLAREARALERALAASARDDSLKNPDPESYKSFGLPQRASARGKWEHGGSMRFFPRWVASVPGIDLGGTFQCGERILVSSPRQTACLDRTSGTLLWRRALPRATAVPTPLGLVRIAQDGAVTLHDLERGETRFSVHIAPRTRGGAAGAVVNAPGLPRLLALVESDRAVTAIDLVSGDVRWRYTARQPASFRLKRAGRLLLVAGGDSALVALDASSGEVVWRVRDRLPFTGDVAIDRDAAFATAGGPIGPVRLLHVDLWTGELRWARDLPARPSPGQPPLVTPHAVAVPTRDRRGSGVLALARDSGALLWAREPGLAAPTTAWLAVDDLILLNSAAGRFEGLAAGDGHSVYSRDFPRHVEADQPRRLEPVLRSGALFVPQHQVHVLRPRDGEHLGTLPSDLIPDLLRVDEACNVYVAEESGHVGAFGVAPRLTLVHSVA